MTIVHRPCSDPEDFLLLHGLITEVARLQGYPCYCTNGDLNYWQAVATQDEDYRSVEMWFVTLRDQQMLVGFAWPSPDYMDSVVHPDYPEVFSLMLEWWECRAIALALAGAPAMTAGGTLAAHEPPISRVWCFTRDTARESILQRQGYRRQEIYWSHRGRNLDDGIPAPDLPEGYSIRSLRGLEEIEQRAAVHRAAFGTEQMTTGCMGRVMSALGYDHNMDMVVIAPDGSFAAFALMWVNPFGAVLFEPVGCHPAHRRRGLASSVLLAGMRKARTEGASLALVNSWHASTSNAGALYDSVGLKTLDTNYQWIKPLM